MTAVRFIEWSPFDKASHIWAYIEDPTMKPLKTDIRDDLNRTYHYRYETVQYFNSNVLRYLKAFAGRRDLVLVKENGYIFTETDEDWAYRMVIRGLRYGTTLGHSITDPGSGLSILARSSLPANQVVYEKATLFGLVCREIRRGLVDADVVIKEKDRAAAAKAKAMLYST